MRKKHQLLTTSEATTVSEWLAEEGLLEKQELGPPVDEAVAHSINTFADTVARGYQLILREAAMLPGGEARVKEFTIPDAILKKVKREGGLGRYLEAKGTLQGVIHFSGETMATIYDIGCRFAAAKSYEEASCVFQYLIYLNPYVAWFWHELGRCWQGMQRWSEALYAACVAINCDPYEPDLYRDVVYVCREYHRLDIARTLLEHGKERMAHEEGVTDRRKRIGRIEDMLAYVENQRAA